VLQAVGDALALLAGGMSSACCSVDMHLSKYSGGSREVPRCVAKKKAPRGRGANHWDLMKKDHDAGARCNRATDKMNILRQM
jgi:hypothetical protein